jgi:fermentation-respiration switch protein FrsA (DUF1100 family)
MTPALYKIVKKPFFGRFMVKWENPLSANEQQHWNPFTVKSKSGALLKGLWSPANHEAQGTIVLGHPMGKEAKGYFLKNDYRSLYHGCSLNVIVFDFNGFGESTHGNFSFFEDVIAVGNFAAAQFPSIPLLYHGISLGGQWSTISFSQDHMFDFALLESIPTTLEEFWVRYPVAYRCLKLLYLLMPRYAKKVRMIDRIAELKRIRSLLLIYSEQDEYTPVSMGIRFKNKTNVPAELWTVKEGEHAKIIKSGSRMEYQEKLKSHVTACVKSYHAGRK